MYIQNQKQYNQAISRYKLLSATAGVGSIVTTDLGNYALISDVGQWPFIRSANQRILTILNDTDIAVEERYKQIKKDLLDDLGIEVVDDRRFVEFLQTDRGLSMLQCLAAIPQLSLNENFNTLNENDNPVIKKLKDGGHRIEPEDFTVPATHFPKWFRNHRGDLKTYHEWKEQWRRAGKAMQFFAPPRDPEQSFPNKRKFRDGFGNEIEEHRELTQLNLILICENGHLSDIPWPRYLNWRTQLRRSGGDAQGDTLFTNVTDCCENPKIKWSENKNRSEGYASIYIECRNCHLGDGNMADSNALRPKISLEGINNLKPICPGHKPWELRLDQATPRIPADDGCSDNNGVRRQMQIALVTGNNVYFANTFNSIYIPSALLSGVPEEVDRLLQICLQKYAASTDPAKDKVVWADRRIDAEMLDEYRAVASDRSGFLRQLKEVFIQSPSTLQRSEDEDEHEFYKRQEYHVFSNNTMANEPDLMFSDISLPGSLGGLFKKIQKVEELKVTSVQMDFTRVSPNERVRDQQGNIIAGATQDIFSNDPDELFILPAVENFGEGIFFDLNEDSLNEWMDQHEDRLNERIAPLMPRGGAFNGAALRQRIGRDGAKLLLIHTFSHLVMRELEFTCGYPTASLKERLYISPQMSGILIYTADGSEGSMGGLIWQAHPERITLLLEKAMERAVDCSADPLCWEETDGQGVFNMNLSACFSCALVSETACEERNLALDRRVLVDPEFGYFKDLVRL